MGKRYDQIKDTQSTSPAPALGDYLLMADVSDSYISRIITVENLRDELRAEPTGTDAQGDVYYYSGTQVEALAVNTKGKALTTGGSGANPSWEGMTTSGDIEYHNGTTRTRLAKGSDTNLLTLTAGIPAWVAASSSAVFASGTKMLFYQDTAPIGWTIDNTLDDKIVYITKGSAAGGQTGGGVHSTGSWTISGFDANVGGHTLASAEMPAHTHTGPSHRHTVTSYQFVEGGTNMLEHTICDLGSSSSSYTSYDGTGNTGSAGSDGSHTHAMASHNGTWRPSAYCCIICEKD